MELGFSALAALARTWDTAEPEDEEDAKKLHIWKAGCVQLANTFSALLQGAWLTSIQVCTLPRTRVRRSGLYTITSLRAIILSVARLKHMPWFSHNRTSRFIRHLMNLYFVKVLLFVDDDLHSLGLHLIASNCYPLLHLLPQLLPSRNLMNQLFRNIAFQAVVLRECSLFAT